MKVGTRPLRRLVLSQLFLLIIFGMATLQAWGQAGNFQFTTSEYFGTELETTTPNDGTFNRDAAGILVTVSRTAGTTGRMLVDYATFDDATLGTLATATLRSFGAQNDIFFTALETNGTYNGITITLFTTTNPPSYVYDPAFRVLAFAVGSNTLASDIIATVNGDLTLPFIADNAPGNDGSGTFSRSASTFFTGGVGAALAGTDYFPATGTLVFSDYQMSASFVVPSLANGIIDGTRLFKIQLTNARPDVVSGESSSLLPTLDPTPATIRVEDSDNSISTNAGVIQFTRAFYRRSEQVGTANIQLTRSGGLDASASVNYQILLSPTNTLAAGSSDASSADLAGSLSGTVTFPVNSAVADIAVDIVDDGAIEFNEDFQIVLSNPSPTYSPLGIDDTTFTITNLASGYILGEMTRATVTIEFEEQPGGEQPAGAVDRNYNRDSVAGTVPPFNPNPGANYTVNVVAVQPDGRTVLGGDFTTVNGSPRNRIARMNMNGSLDTNFSSGSGPNDFIEAVAIYNSGPQGGKIIIGGGFSSFNGVQRNSIARLNADGSLDGNFNPAGGANGPVYAVAIQNDDRIIVAGDFTVMNGVSRNRIARLNPNGSLDTSFNPASGADNTIWAVALKDNGTNGQSVIIGGDFNSVNGQSRGKIAQLDSSGALDASFNPGAGADDSIYTVAAGNAGILIGGAFTTLDAQSRNGIARLNADGSLDTSFNPGTGADNSVFSLIEQPDGRVLIGGIFKSVNGTRRINIARLLNTGKVDTSFMDMAFNQFAGLPNPVTTTSENFVNSISLQTDGDVIIGGSFRRVGGGFSRTDMRNRSNIARLIGGETPGPGNIEFTQNNYYGDETSGAIYVSVTRVNGDLGVVSAAFNTVDFPAGPGAATANLDYAPPLFQPTWADGTSGGQTTPITVIPDALVEGDEITGLSLSIPDGAIVLNGEPIATGVALGKDSSLMTILDLNFSSGVFSFSSPTYTINENGVSATIVVTRTNGSTGPVSVDYVTADGTAVGGLDYTPKSGSLAFASGQTSKSFTISVLNDNIAEQDETVVFSLRNARGGAALDFSSVDPSFNPGLGADGQISAMTFQTNLFLGDQLLVAGEFTTFDGVTRNRLARLNLDGTLDTNFLATDVGANGSINAVVAQGDGKILVAGNFTEVNGVARNRIARLNEDGTLDPFFDPGTGADDGTIYAMILQSTGEVLIGGDFTTFNGVQANHLARLTTDGAFDASFNIGEGVDGPVYAIALQNANGVEKILVGGAFSSIDLASASGIARLDITGALDPQLGLLFGANGPVNAIGVQADSSVLIGGDFTSVDFFDLNRIARISSSGGLDLTFNPGTGANGRVLSIRSINEGIYSGKIIVGGEFTAFNSTARNYAARLNSNGSLDNAFNPVANGPIYAILTQSDTKVTLGGAFSGINGVSRLGVARISTPASTLTIIDDDYLPGRASFVTGSYSTEEGGIATVTVQRTGGSLGVLKIDYAVTNGTAIDADFTPAIGTITWNSGDSSAKSFSVATFEDDLVEGNETIQLQLSNPRVNGNAATNSLGIQTNAVVTIIDNDAVGTFSFNSSVYLVNENAGFATITVLRKGGSAGLAKVDYSTSDGTADPTNYTAVNGTLEFLSGETSKTFIVPITDDTEQNPLGEVAVDLILSNPDPVDALLGSPFTAVLRIIDNESVNTPAGTLDSQFSSLAGTDNTVYALALQADQKILLGGDFTTVNNASRNYIARLNTDGTLDISFPASSANVNGSVRAVTVQTDGRVLIGGLFSTVGTANLNHIARFNPDGAIDSSFNPGAGTDGSVLAIAESFVGANRKINIAGTFATVNGISRGGIARLNDNGTLDTTFNPGAGVNGVVYGLAVQPNGKVVIVGNFAELNSLTRANIARLNTDGSVDTTFDSALSANSSIRAVSIQNDGRILIGGTFTQVADSGQTNQLNRIARLNADGSIDSTFVPGLGANDAVYAITLQLDGKIVLGGEFTRASDVTRSRITRLNSDGTVDPSINFGNGANNFISALAVQEDGKIIMGGGFTEFDSQPHLRIARVYGGSISGAGTLEFVSAAFQADETATNAVITVRRRGGTEGDITVDFATSDNSARASFDYVSTNGVLTFKTGETIQTFTVPVINTTDIGDKSLNLSLTNATGGATLGNQSTATLTIISDDALLSFSSASYRFSESAATGNATIRVIRTGSARGTVSVTFATGSGTATAPADYTTTNGVLIFADGETNKTFNIALLDDTAVEGDETVNVQLLNPIGASLGAPLTSILTIVDDDFAPGALGFSGSFAVDETSTNGVITVVRTGGSAGVVTVNYSSSPGSATSGVDYGATSGTLTFADGVLTNTFVVPIIDDNQVEGNETVLLQLFNPTGNATISQGSVVLTIIDNDVYSTTFTFTNANQITINDNGVATPYPVIIPVSGLTGVVSKVTVSLNKLTHAKPEDLDILLVGPNDRSVLLLSDAGAVNPVSGITLSFDDAASSLAPQNALLTTSTNKPTNYGSGDAFAAPAPTNSFDTALSVFNGINPNGNWRLFVMDDSGAEGGWITNGWNISITTIAAPTTNDLAVTITDSADPIAVNGIVTYNVLVTNRGPNIATGVTVFDTLPTGSAFLAAFPSQGSSMNLNGIVICDLGSLSNGATATISIDVRLQNLGNFTNSATVVSAEYDSNPANNTAAEGTTTFSIGTGLIITANTNANELAAAVAPGTSTGIKVTSAKLSAHVSGAGASSGLFQVGSPPVTYGLTLPGIIMSTGDVLDYGTGPNNVNGFSTGFGVLATPAQQVLLAPITGNGTNTFNHFDVTEMDITFDMLPGFDRVTFKVVFGSEEYTNFVNSAYIDGFGIYLNGTNIAYTAGIPININHPDMLPLPGTELNGVLAPASDPILTFSAPVVSGSSNNTLIFIVADTSDSALDTTVYISSLQGAQAPNADLEMILTATPEPVTMGSNLTYTATVNNRGPDLAGNVVLTDVLPAGFNLLSVSPSQGTYSINNGVVTCNFGSIPRNASATATIIGTPAVANKLTNSASVTSDLADLRPTNNTAVVVSTVIEPGSVFNTQPIIIADGGPALTYPSSITLSNFSGSISKLTVTLADLSHAFPADIDALLVGPAGQKVILMSDAGVGNDLNNVTLKFDDNATNSLPLNGQILSGTYKPTDGPPTNDVFAAPAPAGPYGTNLSVFNATSPNGTWLLYLMDDQGSDAGILSSGWRLTIELVNPPVLKVERSGSNVILSWPVSASGYALEFKDSLTSAVWNPVVTAPTDDGVRYSVTVDASTDNRFFRLKK